VIQTCSVCTHGLKTEFLWHLITDEDVKILESSTQATMDISGRY